MYGDVGIAQWILSLDNSIGTKLKAKLEKGDIFSAQIIIPCN